MATVRPFQVDDLHGEIMSLLEALDNLAYLIEKDANRAGKVRNYVSELRECLKRLNELLT